VGSQYRSAIFYASDEQQKAAQAYIAELSHTHMFSKPIVTQVAPLDRFFAAEAYHQNYLAQHMTQPYIVYNDLPKLDKLEKTYPALYRQ
jgi:peptide-methionine (S)-S-oxide reductase